MPREYFNDYKTIEEQKRAAENTNELLNYLIDLVENNNKRFNFEWGVGGEFAKMEIFDKGKQIGYIVKMEAIKYDENGEALNL